MVKKLIFFFFPSRRPVRAHSPRTPPPPLPIHSCEGRHVSNFICRLLLFSVSESKLKKYPLCRHHVIQFKINFRAHKVGPSSIQLISLLERKKMGQGTHAGWRCSQMSVTIPCRCPISIFDAPSPPPKLLIFDIDPLYKLYVAVVWRQDFPYGGVPNRGAPPPQKKRII